MIGFPDIRESDFEGLLNTLSSPSVKGVCRYTYVSSLQNAYCVSDLVLSTLHVFISSSLQRYDVCPVMIPMTGKEAEAQSPNRAVWPWSACFHHYATAPPLRSDANYPVAGNQKGREWAPAYRELSKG